MENLNENIKLLERRVEKLEKTSDASYLPKIPPHE